MPSYLRHALDAFQLSGVDNIHFCSIQRDAVSLSVDYFIDDAIIDANELAPYALSFQ